MSNSMRHINPLSDEDTGQPTDRGMFICPGPLGDKYCGEPHGISYSQIRNHRGYLTINCDCRNKALLVLR